MNNDILFKKILILLLTIHFGLNAAYKSNPRVIHVLKKSRSTEVKNIFELNWLTTSALKVLIEKAPFAYDHKEKVISFKSEWPKKDVKKFLTPKLRKKFESNPSQKIVKLPLQASCQDIFNQISVIYHEIDKLILNSQKIKEVSDLKLPLARLINPEILDFYLFVNDDYSPNTYEHLLASGITKKDYKLFIKALQFYKAKASKK